jgi:hypothetical protein
MTNNPSNFISNLFGWLPTRNAASSALATAAVLAATTAARAQTPPDNVQMPYYFSATNACTGNLSWDANYKGADGCFVAWAPHGSAVCETMHVGTNHSAAISLTPGVQYELNVTAYTNNVAESSSSTNSSSTNFYFTVPELAIIPGNVSPVATTTEYNTVLGSATVTGSVPLYGAPTSIQLLSTTTPANPNSWTPVPASSISLGSFVTNYPNNNLLVTYVEEIDASAPPTSYEISANFAKSVKPGYITGYRILNEVPDESGYIDVTVAFNADPLAASYIGSVLLQAGSGANYWPSTPWASTQLNTNAFTLQAKPGKGWAFLAEAVDGFGSGGHTLTNYISGTAIQFIPPQTAPQISLSANQAVSASLANISFNLSPSTNASERIAWLGGTNNWPVGFVSSVYPAGTNNIGFKMTPGQPFQFTVQDASSAGPGTLAPIIKGTASEFTGP